MSRPISELKDAFRVARSQSNIDLLSEIADELDALDTVEAEALASRCRATTEAIKGDFTKAFDRLYTALKRFSEIGDKTAVAAVTADIAMVHADSGDYTSALENYFKALDLHEAAGNREGVAAVTNNLGIIYHNTGDSPKSLEFYHRALALHREVGNRFYEANTTGNIGIVYGDIGDREKGLEYLFKALDLHKELGNIGGEASTYGNIGSFYTDLERPEEGEPWLRKGIVLAEEKGIDDVLALHVINLAKNLHQQGRLSEAVDVVDRYSETARKFPQSTTALTMLKSEFLADKGDLEGAKQLILDALDQASARNERKGMAEINKALRDLAKKMGDLESYVQFNEAYQTLTEEVSGAESARKMAIQEKDLEIEAERRERDREREILYGALPQHIAERLIRGEQVTDNFENASVMFLDIAGFTRIASRVPPGHVVHLLEAIFTVCDDVCKKHGVTKIKTIGDSYMAVAGVPDIQQDHVERAARAATEIQDALVSMQLQMPSELGDTSWTQEIGEVNARIGVHCGPVVAGVVGKERLQFDVWGDAVNVASRMESTGEPGKVQVSETFALSLTDHVWALEKRVAQEVKGKGIMQTYWLDSR